MSGLSGPETKGRRATLVPLGMGHYYETYEKRDGTWLFTSRRLKYLFTERSPGTIFPPKGPS